MATIAERILLAMKQAEDTRTIIYLCTHEAYLLALKAKARYMELRDHTDFENAHRVSRAELIETILKKKSREKYTLKQYLKAGGTKEDYALICECQKSWKENERKMRILRESRRRQNNAPQAE